MEMKEIYPKYQRLLPLKIKGRGIDCKKNKRNSSVSRKGSSDQRSLKQEVFQGGKNSPQRGYGFNRDSHRLWWWRHRLVGNGGRDARSHDARRNGTFCGIF